jgi:hypothetical protein
MGDIIGSAVTGGTGIGGIVAGMLISDETKDVIADWRKEYPEYQIPGSIEEQSELLRRRSLQTQLPGQSIMEQQIQGGTAQGIAASREAATSASDLLGATTQLYGQQTQAMTDLQLQAARQQAANELNYAQSLGQRAQYEEQQYMINELIPWQSRMNELMNIQQSAMDLTTSGISTLAGSGSQLSSGSTISSAMG